MTRSRSPSVSSVSSATGSGSTVSSIATPIDMSRACESDAQTQKSHITATTSRKNSLITSPIAQARASGANLELASPVSMEETSHEGVDSLTMTASIRLSVASSPATLTPPVEFPTFFTSDLKIHTCLTRQPKVWQLHSDILARHSNFFARTIRVKQASSGVDTECSYVIELSDGQVQLFPIIEEDQIGTELSGQAKFGNNSLKAEDHEDTAHETIKFYNQIFGSFYKIPPYITCTSISRATTEAEKLAKLAKELGCTQLISSHIGNALMHYRKALYEAILADPPRYLLLAFALENDFIHTESLIRLIGVYPYGRFSTSPKRLPEEILHLIARKSRELDTQVLEVERELLLLTVTTEPRKEPYRCDVSSHFDTWFVVQLFRDALATALRQHDVSRPSLKRGSLIRKIRAGGSRYMVYEEVRRMVQKVMPSAVDTLEEDLKILKEYASEFVKDLARNEASVDVEEHNVGWLTCVKVEKGDIPWRARAARAV